ncbi:hypothetical protein [Mycobacterium spongiae]|uniref:Uncharacterized protein n=1 Tax=Mycobacterium spongiae TaxID=886343 RepID=A0A975PX76_9MYCO|nr:hypothetical protein [Mycobacterium spongiae]QUR67915.1 hypothetical protein F6B93_13100 [Mycobacterium spongiae]
MTTNYPPAPQWTPAPLEQARRSNTWPAVALAGIATLLGAAALVVALTRANNSTSAATPATAPRYTAAETAAAHEKLCEIYKLAARSVQIDTNSDNPAFARVGGLNGAVMLGQAVNGAPALPPGERSAAVALAEAYTNANAVASFATGRDDPAWRAAADDVIAKDAQMKSFCG